MKIVLLKPGLAYFDNDTWRNCIPREWDHVSDGFGAGGVYHGFVVNATCLVDTGTSLDLRSCRGAEAAKYLHASSVRPFILLWHVEDAYVEHVLAIACLMRILEKLFDGVQLVFLTTGVYYPAAIIMAVGNNTAVELASSMLNDVDAFVTVSEEVDELAVIDALLAFIDKER